MAVANLITGVATENSPCTLLGRIVGADGDPIQQADMLEIQFTVNNIPMSRAYYQALFGSLPSSNSSLIPLSSTGSVVNVKPQESVTISDVVFDTLQLDNRWDQDSIGYNFALPLGASDFPFNPDLTTFPTPFWERIDVIFTPQIGDAYSVGWIMMVNRTLAGRNPGVGTGT